MHKDVKHEESLSCFIGKFQAYFAVPKLTVFAENIPMVNDMFSALRILLGAISDENKGTAANFIQKSGLLSSSHHDQAFT